MGETSWLVGNSVVCETCPDNVVDEKGVDVDSLGDWKVLNSDVEYSSAVVV